MLDIVADESVNYRFVKRLRADGFSVTSIAEKQSGIPDQEVLKIARSMKAVLITEDSDFGEWVFAHHEKGLHVLYLRYPLSAEERLYRAMVDTLTQFTPDEKVFAVITPKKIRKRPL